jgi:DUF4097 and DUF4098 domain-containing protein YvlB
VRIPVLLSVLGLGVTPFAAAETTRTLKAELPAGDTTRYAVENLAGSMKVTVGSGDKVEAVATLHAESDAMADGVRFERVVGEHGVTTLRMRYPLDGVSEVRYPGGETDGGLLLGLFKGSSTETKYDGHRVRITGRSGTLFYADIEVRVPRHSATATFKTGVGPMTGSDLDGTIVFDTSHGPVTLAHMSGDVLADTGSGDVEATDIKGSFKCDTGSGECVVTRFSGERLVCDTGSGKVRVSAVQARSISVDSGSGNVRLEDTDAEDVNVDTGSGSLDVESPSRRLTRLKADTGSGSVKLRLSPDAGFEAYADLGSGDIVNHYADAQPILKRREVVGYRRGDGHIRIDVDTGSGSLILEPAR